MKRQRRKCKGCGKRRKVYTGGMCSACTTPRKARKLVQGSGSTAQHQARQASRKAAKLSIRKARPADRPIPMWSERSGGRCLYFAYGSNLHLEQMAIRCPTSRLVCTAALDGWRLAERVHADIEPGGDSDVVYGALFDIGPDDEHALDRYEGVRGGYYVKRTVNVVSGANGHTFAALTYVMGQKWGAARESGAFSEGYALTCAIGAIDCGIPIWRTYAERARLIVDGDVIGDRQYLPVVQDDIDEISELGTGEYGD